MNLRYWTTNDPMGGSSAALAGPIMGTPAEKHGARPCSLSSRVVHNDVGTLSDGTHSTTRAIRAERAARARARCSQMSRLGLSALGRRIRMPALGMRLERVLFALGPASFAGSL